MPYVVSTLSNDQIYTDYHVSTDGGANTPKKEILIKGGANVAHKSHDLGDGVFTPPGVVTFVTDEEFAVLQKIDQFDQHLKAGHLKVVHKEVETAKEIRSVVSDMKPADNAAPLTPEDYEEGGRMENSETGAPVVNSAA